MYYIDTPSAQIDAMDFNAGEVSNRRAVVKGFDFETTGFPDGSFAQEYGEEGGGLASFFCEIPKFWVVKSGSADTIQTKIAMLFLLVHGALFLRHLGTQLGFRTAGTLEVGPHPVSTAARCAIDLEEWPGRGSA